MPTPLTRTFRQGLSDGRNGEQRVIDSNLPNGIGQRRQYEPGTGQGYGTGQGRSTGLTPLAPSGPAPRLVNPAAAVSPSPSAVTRSQMAERAARVARAGAPNAGGAISRSVAPGVTAVQRYAPSPAANMAPDRPNLGGTMTRGGVTTNVPGSPAATIAAPVVSSTTTAAQQTESANPLTGDGNDQAPGTTDAVDPGSALGLNRRGSSTPQGDDAVQSPASSNIGGSGLYARKFSNPRSAGVYESYIKKLFPDVA